MRPATYNDEYLKEYCDNDGTSNAVEKHDPVKIENPETKKLFEVAGEAFKQFDASLAAIEKHLGLQ